MPVLEATDALFTPRQETILAALGTIRAVDPEIDLPTLCRFDTGRASYYISDADQNGRLYGVVAYLMCQPVVGYIERSDLEAYRASGKLYRGDVEQPATIGHIASVARMRAA